MALPMREPRPLTVKVDVDDVTIVLGLLSFLTLDRDEDDPLVGIANRASDRLRENLATVASPPPAS